MLSLRVMNQANNETKWRPLHSWGLVDSYTIVVLLMISISSSVNFVVILTYKAGFRNRKLCPYKPKAASDRESRPECQTQSRFRRRLTETMISVPKSMANNRNDDYTECLFPTQNCYIYRRTLCSYFILVLAVCDLFISVVNMPISLVYQSPPLRSLVTLDRSLLPLLCPLGHFVYQVPIVLELEIVALIALDRYSSVFRSIDSYFFDKNKFIILTMTSFVLACLISLPQLLLVGADVSNSHCTTKQVVGQRVYETFLMAVFVINLSCIVTCYIRVYTHIYRTLRTQRAEHKPAVVAESKILYKRRVSCPVDLRSAFGPSHRADYLASVKAKRARKLSENQMASSAQNSYQNVKAISIRRHTSRKYKHTKTATVLALTILVIVFTWAPFWLHKLLVLHPHHHHNCVLSKIFNNLYLLNYVLNPLFYSFVNKRFRKNALYLAKSFCSSC
ncbi:5-hydroxytryptamine receptor 1F-like [Brachionus plicatilis]|uniref:5-hydroxytryptamine receptor 1F-like n=1 Tax=Brachionus plicatilis TaxID=10195 RepID=A0A3M7R7S8_BRAPC|nr:5-hydroxytryptamine receptor 1F-like [Brachionus plicatilis]